MDEKWYWLWQAKSYKEKLSNPDCNKEWVQKKIKIYELLAELDNTDLHFLFDSTAFNKIYLGYLDLAIDFAKKHNDFTEDQLDVIKQVRYDCYLMLDIHNAFEAESFYLNS